MYEQLAKQLHGKPLKAANEDGTLPLCWKGNKPFRSVSDYKRYFNSLVLSFGKRAVLEIPPEGYLITTVINKLAEISPILAE